MEECTKWDQSQSVLYTLADYVIPQNAIEQDALSLMDVVSPSSLRGAERRIAEVIPLTASSDLRSTDTVPLAYVVNFTNYITGIRP